MEIGLRRRSGGLWLDSCFSSKALVRKPSRFERFLTGGELLAAHDESISHRVDDRHAHVDPGLAPLHLADSAGGAWGITVRAGRPPGSRGTCPAPRSVRPKGGTASSPRQETRRLPRRNGARLPPTRLRSSWSEERLDVGLIAFRLFTHLQSMRRSKEKGASNGLRATDPRDAGPGQDP